MCVCVCPSISTIVNVCVCVCVCPLLSPISCTASRVPSALSPPSLVAADTESVPVDVPIHLPSPLSNTHQTLIKPEAGVVRSALGACSPSRMLARFTRTIASNKLTRVIRLGPWPRNGLQRTAGVQPTA